MCERNADGFKYKRITRHRPDSRSLASSPRPDLLRTLIRFVSQQWAVRIDCENRSDLILSDEADHAAAVAAEADDDNDDAAAGTVKTMAPTRQIT